MGSCRANEVYTMALNNLQDSGAILLTVPKTKMKIPRKFTINDSYNQIYKK